MLLAMKLIRLDDNVNGKLYAAICFNWQSTVANSSSTLSWFAESYQHMQRHLNDSHRSNLAGAAKAWANIQSTALASWQFARQPNGLTSRTHSHFSAFVLVRIAGQKEMDFVLNQRPVEFFHCLGFDLNFSGFVCLIVCDTNTKNCRQSGVRAITNPFSI